ncbi:hypothetical protein DSO57_1027221 [Entomophthora muscae]|uniref:Uncharacterized protein n=1 Tax=Entomophthora muscae TaxID=34485 RepID=A0ACC2UM54_9FUNG|nr:hypothetical protein DSO57_1027221 [Entomophthora muscae]
MGLKSVDDFVYVLLVEAVAAVVTNLVLVWVVMSVRNKSREVWLALTLAGVDVTLAMLVIVNFSLKLDNVFTMEEMCRFKGPLDFVLIFASMALVSIISLERSSVAVSRRVTAGVWGLLGLVSGVFLSLVFVETINMEFTVTASGLACAPVASNSPLSAFLLFVLSASIFTFLIITFVSYVRILVLLGGWGLIEPKPDSPDQINPVLRKRSVMIRILSISFIYLLLLAPCSLTMMMESLKVVKAPDVASLIISILLATVSIINPCIILFAHTAIYRQLCFKLTEMLG